MVFAPVAVELNNEDCCSCCGGESPGFKGRAVRFRGQQNTEFKSERRQQAPNERSCHIGDVIYGRSGVIALFRGHQGIGRSNERADNNSDDK